METRFFVQKDYYYDNDLDDKITNIDLDYDNMIYRYKDPETGEIYNTIPLKFGYTLYKDDVDFFLKEYAKDEGVSINGDLLTFLTKDLIYENTLYSNIEYLLDTPKYNKLMLDHCRERANKEFIIAFEYWVDQDEIPEYLETETLD